MRWLRLTFPVLVFLAGPSLTAGPAAPVARIERDAAGQYTVTGRNARLADLAAALSRAADCRCTLDDGLPDRAVTVELTPRSLERVSLSLARSASVRLRVIHRLEPALAGESLRFGRREFARNLVQPEHPGFRPVRDAAGELGTSVHVTEGVRGTVRFSGSPRPLGELLDQMARQTGSRRVLVLHFEARPPTLDPSAAEAGRMHEHLDELAQLSTEDRRAELADEMKRLERLPEVERSVALRRMAADITSLGALLHRVPGEHRLNVGSQVVPVARDYGHVISGLRSRQRTTFRPLFEALQQLDSALRSLR